LPAQPILKPAKAFHGRPAGFAFGHVDDDVHASAKRPQVISNSAACRETS
jgi:hypothetical protein